VRAFQRLRVLALVGGITFASALSGVSPTRVAATTGPYSLPFFDHTVNRTQGCHQGCAYDYGTGYKPVAASRRGQVVERKTGFGEGDCSEAYADKANYVVIKHPDNQHTIYWHLSEVEVSVGDFVNDGERIGVSGNSGYSCGAHLHYALYASADRSASNSLVPDGRWTVEEGHPGTNHPGRVPWLAAYSDEKTSGTVNIIQYGTVTHWVEFRNSGAVRGTTPTSTTGPAESGSTL
jgi:murein DD-endopeptidase MepM/ murein hydrolase activator NlpD